ncbi:MAG TPA: response regulator [Anaerolineae bacterium]|nr:response regulator [Anaerolineae bacterium]
MSRGDILIADDTPANLRLLSNMLSDQGYKVRAVINGQMALTAVHAAPPDLILLDIRMPGMSGYEVCEALKADPSTQDIPVIFISALDEIHAADGEGSFSARADPSGVAQPAATAPGGNPRPRQAHR